MTDKFEQLESYYDDLSPNGKWLIDEVRRLRAEREWLIDEVRKLRAGEESQFNKQRQLNLRLHTIWELVQPVVEHDLSADLLDIVSRIVAELKELRAKEVPPLSDSDQLGQIIENVSGRVYDKQACEDINWMVRELAKLRALIKWVNQQLDTSSTGTWVPSAHRGNTREIVKQAAHHLRGWATELAEVHDILAEALGYEKAPSAEEDPNCPCPGDYITGEHTSVTLAMEAARRIKGLRQMIDDYNTPFPG